MIVSYTRPRQEAEEPSEGVGSGRRDVVAKGKYPEASGVSLQGRPTRRRAVAEAQRTQGVRVRVRSTYLPRARLSPESTRTSGGDFMRAGARLVG